MKRFAPRGLVMVALLLLAPFWPCRFGHAAGEPPDESDLKRKQGEVERLKKDLNQAQDELKKLQKENRQLREEKEKAKADAVKSHTPAPAKPVRPVASLPALRPGEVVDVDELVGQFANEAAAASARYAGKALRIRGEAAGFGSRLFLRQYSVRLQSADRAIRVVCSFNYLGSKFRAVYTKEEGQVLVAQLGEHAERPLLRVGDQVVIEGRCKGLSKGVVEFTGCALAH